MMQKFHRFWCLFMLRTLIAHRRKPARERPTLLAEADRRECSNCEHVTYVKSYSTGIPSEDIHVRNVIERLKPIAELVEVDFTDSDESVSDSDISED